MQMAQNAVWLKSEFCGFSKVLQLKANHRRDPQLIAIDSTQGGPADWPCLCKRQPDCYMGIEVGGYRVSNFS